MRRRWPCRWRGSADNPEQTTNRVWRPYHASRRRHNTHTVATIAGCGMQCGTCLHWGVDRCWCKRSSGGQEEEPGLAPCCAPPQSSSCKASFGRPCRPQLLQWGTAVSSALCSQCRRRSGHQAADVQKSRCQSAELSGSYTTAGGRGPCHPAATVSSQRPQGLCRFKSFFSTLLGNAEAHTCCHNDARQFAGGHCVSKWQDSEIGWSRAKVACHAWPTAATSAHEVPIIAFDTDLRIFIPTFMGPSSTCDGTDRGLIATHGAVVREHVGAVAGAATVVVATAALATVGLRRRWRQPWEFARRGQCT